MTRDIHIIKIMMMIIIIIIIIIIINWQKQPNCLKIKVHIISKYTAVNVLLNDNFKLYWNRSILTDKTISFIRPDVTFMNRKTKNTFLTDTAVPNTHNLAQTITDKQQIPRIGE